MMSLYFIGILSFFMGLVTSISGGGGVFGIPVMLAFGLPTLNALALNRISDLGTLAGAVKNYCTSKEMDWGLAKIVAPPFVIGGLMGVSFVVNSDSEFLKYFVVSAVFVGMFFLILPYRAKEVKAKPNYYLGIPLLILVGFWDGSVAMAGATFAMIILVAVFHKSFISARSSLIIAAIPETMISSSVLIYAASLKLSEIAVMFFASVLGAYAGSKLAIKKGNNFIRFTMVGISFVMCLKIIFFDL